MIPTDADLLYRTAARDREAFAALYDRFAGRTFGLILKFLRNQTDAEDVLQETFLQVWNRADRFDPARGCAESWVLLLARSRSLDRLRRRGIVEQASAAVEPAAEACCAAEADDAAGTLHSALEILPPDQRRLVRLAFFDGMTHEEIARRTNTPLGTVKTRIRSGLTRLRDRLAPARESLV